MVESIDIRSTGAVGDGVADDSAAIQAALDAGAEVVTIPDGVYRVAATLRVPSHRRIIASPGARLVHCGETPKRRGDFLLTNADHVNGNCDITLTGGVWDGNNQGRCNTKCDDLFHPEAWSGTLLNFFRVKKLKLESMELANSVVYYTRFCRVSDFEIRDIGFSSEKPAFNQDGLHFGGFVSDGVIENIRALTPGQTNDDLLALNADDSLVRLENLDLECGPIENLTFRNVFAEDCHTAVRLLSVTSPIRNIRIENLEAGCRNFAINMDGARYCRTPLFQEDDFPEGCGLIENFEVDGLTIHSTASKRERSMIHCESRVKNFRLNRVRRVFEKDVAADLPTFGVRHVVDFSAEAFDEAGRSVAAVGLGGKEDFCYWSMPFARLKLN